MIETHRYSRKPFEVDAVRVSVENQAEVAQWCSGEIVAAPGGSYIRVKVHSPQNDNQSRAHVGDWVLYAHSGYKVYTDKAFKKGFELVSSTPTMQLSGAPAIDGVNVVKYGSEQVDPTVVDFVPPPGPTIHVPE